MAKKKSKAHPWFANVAKSIANKQGISIDKAGAILASSTRKSSKKAKKANPRLKKVKGKAKKYKGMTINKY